MSIHEPLQEHRSKDADQSVQLQLREMDRRIRALETQISQLDKRLKALEEK